VANELSIYIQTLHGSQRAHWDNKVGETLELGVLPTGLQRPETHILTTH